MDVIVELPDGTTKLVPVSVNCSVRAATHSTALRAGLSPVANKLTEFSLAKKSDSSLSLVDVHWLDQTQPLKDQCGERGPLRLLFLKKFFSANNDLSVLSLSNVLLKNVYSQLRHAYVRGLYRCTQSEAAHLSALIARAEFSLSELRPGSLQKTGRLKAILPPLYLNSPVMERNILTALSSVAKLSESVAQEQFIEQVRKSDTFGLSLHTITLEQRGGESREALLGVGIHSISVLETHNLQVMVQWKTADLTKHSYTDSTFSMTYGSEVVTMVTDHGHMISAFLSGMAVSSSGKPARPPKPANLQNGETEEMADRAYSTHIKSVGKRVERFEKQARPTAPPRPTPAPRVPPARPLRPSQHSRPSPPRPSHTPLRSTRSVPLIPLPALPTSFLRGVATKDAPPISDANSEGALYEVPIQRKPAGKTSEQKKTIQLPTCAEAHYETSDQVEEESLTSVPKLRPLLPPPPQGKRALKQLLKKKPLTQAANDDAEKYLVPKIIPSSAKSVQKPHNVKPIKTHKSDSDATNYISENGAGEPPTSPIYDELIQPPEYAELEPNSHSPLLSRERGGKNTAVKRKSQISTPQNLMSPVTPFPNPLSPPPPSSPAPPPPSIISQRSPKLPRGSPSNSALAPPAPRTPAPAPPIYDRLNPEDDLKEVDAVFGAKDLALHVKYSRDANPIYDTLAAVEATSSLKRSDVTFHSFSTTLDRRKRKVKVPRTASGQPQISPPSPASPATSPSSSSPHDYENAELLSLLFKDIPRIPPASGRQPDEQRREKPRKKTPSPPMQRAKLGAPVSNRAPLPTSNESSLQPPTTNGAYGYSRLEHFKNKAPTPTTVAAPAQLQVPPETAVSGNAGSGSGSGGTTNDDEFFGHEYAEVTTPAETKAGRNKQNMFESAEWVMVQDSNAPPVPNKERPQLGAEGEGKKMGPPKPPRMRQRREKIVGKGDGVGRGHKAMKGSDVLRDYSILMKEFRIFHVKLPTGLMHTELANITTEVGKLIKRLCVLLCIEEADHAHFSLYVEGASFTHLSEMGDEDGGEESGMFRRLRQKSPSRIDFFNSSKAFAVVSERSNNPVLLDPDLSFKSQGITTTRILALRPQTMLTNKLPQFQIRVPDWVRFHQCWLGIVQGSLACTIPEAIKLAALQYQAYFLDRTELNSTIGFCRSSDFLPQDFASVKGVEEKVFAEQQLLKGYTRRHAQDSYIFTACALPTCNTIFFHCLEVKRKVMKYNKLAPVLIGMNKEGVVRADFKTKEILDVWPYQVLKNWGYTEQTFILEFDDRTYPLKTGQGRWMNVMVDFFIEAILGNMTTPPVTHQLLGEPSARDKVVPIPHNRDNVDDIYSDLLSVRAQAQQWLAEANNGKPSSSSPPPPSSPPTPHLPSFAPMSPSQTHATSVSTAKHEKSSQRPPQVPCRAGSPPVYEEVDFEPRAVGFYDVLRKADSEDDDAIYDLPPES